MSYCPKLDECLIKYPSIIQLEGISSEIICNLLQGNFKINLAGPFCKDILTDVRLEDRFEDNIRRTLEEKFTDIKDVNKLYEVLSIGISSLQLFVQINWTGPKDSCDLEPPLQFLRKNLVGEQEVSESEWLERLTSELSLDGEAISPNIHSLELLLVARAVLSASVFDHIVSGQWWRLLCLLTHQQVLEERSPSLHAQLTGLLAQLSACEGLSTSADLSALLRLHTACFWLTYGHVGRADEAIRAATKLLGLDISLVGALGKRTKYQEKAYAQLTLSVNVSRESRCNDDLSTAPLIEASHFPKDVKLDDDVRLNQIAFSDSDVSQFPPLTAPEQVAVLASCIHKQKSQPKDRLHTEEITPYLTCLTGQPRVWAVQYAALLQRSRLDCEHRRTVERALMQYQALADSVGACEPSALSRLAWVYCCLLPPAWRVEALLAEVYVSLGMVQTALDVFLKLQLWEEVIACYNLLKLRHKAAEVIRQELEKRRSVKLLCLLGDATDDEDCYRQAWQLSGERSGRAQRHWAMHYFTRKQYAESIPHLERSLELNSLQEALWFRLGFAALHEERWELCASAYRRYCTLEPESFEAWNNLAKAYVKTSQKARAFRALQEAVKCNYENWRVWDNLMAVSTDCGQFDEVIRCYHRILDLNEKHVDLEVLKILTDVIVQDLVNIQNCPTATLRKQSLTLFGRLTAQVLNNSTLWQLYARVAASGTPGAETSAKVAQCLQRAYQAACHPPTWSQDPARCLEVITLCQDLAQAYLQCSALSDSSNQKVQMLSSAKLPLKSVISKIEKEHTDLVTGELPESLAAAHKQLVAHYELVLDEIQRLQAT